MARRGNADAPVGNDKANKREDREPEIDIRENQEGLLPSDGRIGRRRPAPACRTNWGKRGGDMMREANRSGGGKRR